MGQSNGRLLHRIVSSQHPKCCCWDGSEGRFAPSFLIAEPGQARIKALSCKAPHNPIPRQSNHRWIGRSTDGSMKAKGFGRVNSLLAAAAGAGGDRSGWMEQQLLTPLLSRVGGALLCKEGFNKTPSGCEG